MASSSYNVCVIGYGMAAKIFHIPFIQLVPELKLYAIVQRSPKPGDNAEKDCPAAKVFRSTEDMVKDSAVDVVVITTTPDTHYDLAKLALENQKHEYDSNGLFVLSPANCATNRRWDSDFVTLSKLIETGALGRIVEFETHYDRYRPVAPSGTWKSETIAGGGVVYDLGTHLIDQVVAVAGLPKKITGFLGTQRESNTSGYEDSCTVLLHYDGMLATVKASVVSPEVDQLRFWVRGSKGSFKKYHLDCQEDQLKEGKKPDDPGFGVEPSSHYGVLSMMNGEKPVSTVHATADYPTYREFYMQLARALAGKGDVPVKPEEASAVIMLIELARQSSASGKTLDV
ncbi:hypothetical protein MMC20_002718 [Loxospora ochrophaea]|nr:hypothetical protein [Loxospora ochrophaea]